MFCDIRDRNTNTPGMSRVTGNTHRIVPVPYSLFFLCFCDKIFHLKCCSIFRRGRRAAAVRGGGGGVPRDHDAGGHGQQAATRPETPEGASGMGSESG